MQSDIGNFEVTADQVQSWEKNRQKNRVCAQNDWSIGLAKSQPLMPKPVFQW